MNKVDFLTNIKEKWFNSDIVSIDHGKIITQGTAAELKKNTKTDSLEDAFLALTGKDIRDEKASGADHLRQRRQMFSGGGRR